MKNANNGQTGPAPAPATAPTDAPGWTPTFAPLFEIDCGQFFQLILEPKLAIEALQIPNAYQRAEKVIRLAAAAPLLQIAVEAALNMVDGDGAPPRWDMLRAALTASRSVTPGQPTASEPATGSNPFRSKPQ
jgi:hypothetical protein